MRRKEYHYQPETWIDFHSLCGNEGSYGSHERLGVCLAWGSIGNISNEALVGKDGEQELRKGDYEVFDLPRASAQDLFE
jgi:hypothetical protein